MQTHQTHQTLHTLAISSSPPSPLPPLSSGASEKSAFELSLQAIPSSPLSLAEFSVVEEVRVSELPVLSGSLVTLQLPMLRSQQTCDKGWTEGQGDGTGAGVEGQTEDVKGGSSPILSSQYMLCCMGTTSGAVTVWLLAGSTLLDGNYQNSRPTF